MPRGGARKGAGRPAGQGRFGTKTKPVRIPEQLVDDVISFIENKANYGVPLYSSTVSAGYPVIADDHIDERLDLNQYLVKRPQTTFCVKVSGLSMIGAGMNEGDILVVDKSLSPTHGKIVIASVNGELTVKRLMQKESKTFLMPENSDFAPIELSAQTDTVILGVVTTVLHHV